MDKFVHMMAKNETMINNTSSN